LRKELLGVQRKVEEEIIAMSLHYGRHNALLRWLLIVTFILSALALPACSQANATGGAGNTDQPKQFEYTVSFLEPNYDFGNFKLGDVSFCKEGIYGAINRYNPETREYDQESYVVVLDWDLNLVREFPYEPVSADYIYMGMIAAADNGFWTIEGYSGNVANIDAYNIYVRFFDPFGSPLVTVSDKDLFGEGITGLRILAVDDMGRVFISVARTPRSDITAGSHDDVVLIDQFGKIVTSWEGVFTSQLAMTILDDGTPIVMECTDTFSGANAGNVYEMTDDGGLVLVGNIVSATGDLSESPKLSTPYIYAGTGRSIYLEAGAHQLYRLSLDTMEGVVVASYKGVEDPNVTVPPDFSGVVFDINICRLATLDGGNLLGQTGTGSFVVFEKR